MTPERSSETTGDELRWSKGKQPRSPAKAPNSGLSGKRCGTAQTARRLAQKQPSLKECVIAHWSSGPARTMYRGSSTTPKLRDPPDHQALEGSLAGPGGWIGRG